MDDIPKEDIINFTKRFTDLYHFLTPMDANTFYEPILLYKNDGYQAPLYADLNNSSQDVIYLFEKSHVVAFHLNIEKQGGIFFGSLDKSDKYFHNLFSYNLKIMSNVHPDKRGNDKDVAALKREWEINRIINE